ncbi:MAG: CoA-binding protein, partial [Planctomycetaceae bacterium]|nr:CoA-binding protein [Planctomycetaceae bacterium]
VAGASVHRHKYGNQVLRLLQKQGRDVVPVNPNAVEVEGLPAFTALSHVEPRPDAICIITPPDVTEQIVKEAVNLGIQNIWMQPGAESESAIATCEAAGMNVIHSGPCILVVAGYQNF